MASNPRAVLSALKAVGPRGGAPASGGFADPPAGMYSGQVSPLVASYGQWTMGRPYGSGLPRDWQTFLAGAMGPLAPIEPVGIDEPDPDSGRPEPRRTPYQVGWNMPVGVPGSEGIKLASFANLRSIADTYSIARACIDLRIQEILGLEWDIIPTRAAEKQMRNSPRAHKDFQQRRAQAMKFFSNPDPEYGSFGAWLAAALEDVFVVDALSIYMQPSRRPGKGLLGSNLAALCLIAGDSIRPLLDVRGGRPQPPNPAYQQYIYGVPRSDLMTVISGEDVDDELVDSLEREYYRDQLLYLPYVRRTWTPYGMPPAERALIPALSGLRKQQYALDFFDEGCYDDQTEILTRDGWKLFAKLTEDDEVATRSAAGEFQWQKPTERQCYAHNGPLVEFRNKSVDLLVTPNHRMLVRPQYPRPGTKKADWHIRYAQYFVDSPGARFEVPCSSTWHGSGAPDEFVISAVEAKRWHPAWEKAAAWLSQFLADGPRAAGECLRAAKAAGVGNNALVEARRLLGVKTTPGRGGVWAQPTLRPEFADGPYLPRREVRMPIAAWCEFLGLYLAEGWTSSDGNEILIAQFETSRHLPEIKAILNGTGLRWSYDGRRNKFSISSRALVRWLRENTGTLARNKYIPAEVKGYPPDLLERLIHGMMLGDGHWGPQGQRYYTTTSSRLADDLQEVFQKTGVDVWIRPAEPPEGTLGVRRTYVVRERLQRTHGLPRPTTRHYEGNVYCVTVPNSIVYVRRNGRAVWCGNTVPGVFISSGDPNATPNQLRELQDALNAMAGDPSWKHKIIVIPGGSKIDPMRPAALADQFDEIIMTQMCMAYGVMPMELGITPRVSTSQSSGAANQMAKASEQVNQRKALRPQLKWLKASIFDFVLQQICGQPDMQWMWEGLEEGVDEESQVNLLIAEIEHGLKSIDEARVERGEQPWGLPLTSDPVWATQTGIVPVGAIDPATGQPAGLQPALPGEAGQASPTATPAPAAQGQGPAGAGTGKPTPGGKPGQQDTTPTPAHAGATVPAKTTPTATADAPTRPAAKQAQLRELDLLRRHLKKGRSLDDWQPMALPEELLEQLRTNLDGLPAEEAISKARATVRGTTFADRRDSAIGAVQARVAAGLGTLAGQIRAGTLSTIQFVDQATDVMRTGIRDGLRIGARHALTDLGQPTSVAKTTDLGDETGYDDETGDEYSQFLGQVADQQADGQHHYLIGLAQDLLAAAAADGWQRSFTGRFDLYAQQVRAGYMRGYGLTQAAAGDGAVITWRTTSGRPCALCADRDGHTYSFATLPGWPGDAGLCLGDANCRCELLFSSPQGDSSGYNTLRDTDYPQSLDDMQADQYARYQQVQAARDAFINSLPDTPTRGAQTSPRQRAAAREEARRELADALSKVLGRRIWPVDVPADMVAELLHGTPAPTVAQRLTQGLEKAKALRVEAGQTAGKAATPITGHPDGHADSTHEVYAYLGRHYPASDLEWVKTAVWRGPVQVPLDRIDMARRAGGARNPEKVTAIEQQIADGHTLAPIVLVDEPGDGKLEIADGWHRTLALQHTGHDSALAWIGEVHGSWPGAAVLGSAKLNKQEDLPRG